MRQDPSKPSTVKQGKDQTDTMHVCLKERGRKKRNSHPFFLSYRVLLTTKCIVSVLSESIQTLTDPKKKKKKIQQQNKIEKKS